MEKDACNKKIASTHGNVHHLNHHAIPRIDEQPTRYTMFSITKKE
jgi:hypothetical protein